ncbi:Rh-like protein/ammonium transporter [Gonapodya prolifera JEL478]|uniref:Ammonium transporter n=1 Tax=Gonapodya prolifera (strain JEL478) TaxID=1344416 RepID=A0A139A5X0_GONPJ|nr:Rh-like protein/ammonium transporter [Gonapodya prolifera JEL478]|eukprot:KXS12177.1 Rh-like protein/ammonium transporter [Gonapodya prolifera JEL478]
MAEVACPIGTLSYTVTGSDEPGCMPMVDSVFIFVGTAVCMLLIPGGLGMLYGGWGGKRSVLTMMAICYTGAVVISIQYFLFGFSLSYSNTGSSFIGDFSNALLINVNAEPMAVAPALPASIFMLFQCMFAAITPVIIIGGGAERIRIWPMTLFLLLWSTFCYDFFIAWMWGLNGWLKKFGELDFAGGTAVHVASGAAGLALAIFLGPRQNKNVYPASMKDVLLGTGLIWFGWFFFNAGSTLALNFQALNAAVVTHFAACAGCITYSLMGYIHHKKITAECLVNGVIAGLVGITPACGYVWPASSLAIGALTAVCCYCWTHFARPKIPVDDALDTFGLHGVGGIAGAVLTGVFATSGVTELGGYEIPGGWVDGHWIQPLKQLVGVVVIGLWSFVVSYALLFAIDKIPGMKVRLAPEHEVNGSDHAQMGDM